MEQIASGIWRIRLGEPESFTPVSLRSTEIAGEGLAALPSPGDSPFDEREVEFKTTPRGCVVKLPLEGSEALYGFGLQLKSVNQTGRKKYLRVNADPLTDAGDTHAPVPFYVSTAGYGVFIDSARYVSVYCGSSAKVRESKDASPARSVVIDIPTAKGVDIYVFGGPDMKTAVQRYNLFSGGGCLPPFWGLGIWYRPYGKATGEDVLKLAAGFREAQLPVDVIGLEPGWHSHSYSCTYVWDKEKFPQPVEFTEQITRKGYKLNLWEHVYVHPDSPIYDELRPYSGDYEVWGGIVPDLSITEARETFGGYHGRNFVDKGVMGFKLDECDSSDFTGSWAFPNCAEFPSGMDGEQMHSMLGMLYQRTIFDVFRKRNLRTLCQVRASHGLASSMPFVLYSDLYNHSDFIRGVVNAGFSGLLWSPEVRSCRSVEDLIRRVESVVFSPHALINAWTIPLPPWLQYDRAKNHAGELLENAREVESMVRRLFDVRMSLIPYLYSSFAKYRSHGLPPFRALVMDYPSDPNTLNIGDEYMMGDSLLVAPVLADQTGRSVYLPEGSWYCFWTGKLYQGGQSHTVEADLGTIPVFVKSGSMIPLARPVQFVAEDTCFELTVKCYGETCSDFVLFEDDGVTFDFEKGSYNLVTLKDCGDRVEVARSGRFPGRKYTVVGFERVR